MHLGERGGGDGTLVEAGQQVAPARPEVGDQHRLDLGERQGRRGGLQPGQRLAPGGLGVLRQDGLDGRQQLPGLERAALEPAEHAGRPVGAALPGGAPDRDRVLATRAPHRAERGVAQRAGGQLQQPGGPHEPGTGDRGGRHGTFLPGSPRASPARIG